MGDENLEKRTDAEVAASIKEHIERLKGYRTSSFPALEKKPGAKLVRMVAVWKSILAYRLVDIANASLDLFESGRLVPGCILARSVLETVAGVHMLNKRISGVREAEQFEEFENFLLRASFGSRDQSSNFEAFSALTMVDHLHKEYGIRDQYDHLSEYAHPNLKGGLMAYSDIDLKTLSAELGINPRGLPLGAFGLGDLELILEMGIDEYKAIKKNTIDFEEKVWRLPPGFFLD